MIQFHWRYFIFAMLILLTEILIALFVHDAVIRPYVGDFLVVILLYCLMRAFFNVSVFRTALGVLLFSYVVEFLQYCRLVEKLNLEQNVFARVIIGTSFEWIDIVSYTLGIGLVLLLETRKGG